MSAPLVTVICLSYNHERFVLEALESVIAQTYKRLQLIVVDDASTDGSKQVISNFILRHPNVEFIAHKTNLGMCKAFNSGLSLAQGEFIVDFSADDVLPADRVETGVTEFEKRDDSFGVQFGDAINIDEVGSFLSYHSDRFPAASVPQGDIYTELIRKYFISGPSTMVRKQVFDELRGYDDNLAYEDFDFWIRSARRYKYFYTPKVLVKQRIVKGALHEQQFITRSVHAWSTLTVCRKILALNRTRSEQSALASRISYEFRQSVLRVDFNLALEYVTLWRENRGRIYDF